MINIPISEPWLDGKEAEKVASVILSGWVSRGSEIATFENKVAQYTGRKYAIAVSSGTAALEIALRSAGLSGNEVVTSAFSCAATLNAILHAGFKPVFVDIDPETYNIDPEKIKANISENTAAIIPVHVFGAPCEMEEIIKIGASYDIPVIEDGSMSMGATLNGRQVGSFGKAGCFSFYANKTITTGEGGMIVTDSKSLMDSARTLINHGQDPENPFVHLMLGYNFKMSNVHAAIGLIQMDKIEEILQRKRKNALYLTQRLSGRSDLIFLSNEGAGHRNTHFCFPILLRREEIRDHLCSYLEKQGIATRKMFPSMPSQPFFEKLFGIYPTRFPASENASKNGFYVSCSPLLTQEHLDYMAQAIEKALDLL